MDALATARQLMRRHVVVVAPEDSLGRASDLLRMGRMRAVPVLESGRLVGELSIWELVALFRRALVTGQSAAPPGASWPPAGLRALPVRRAMAPPRPGVALETPLRELAQRLVSDAAGYLSVVDGESRLLGIVTESDLLRATLRSAKPRPPARRRPRRQS